jgi:hypothetical protein
MMLAVQIFTAVCPGCGQDVTWQSRLVRSAGMGSPTVVVTRPGWCENCSPGEIPPPTDDFDGNDRWHDDDVDCVGGWV